MAGLGHIILRAFCQVAELQETAGANLRRRALAPWFPRAQPVVGRAARETPGGPTACCDKRRPWPVARNPERQRPGLAGTTPAPSGR